MKKIIYFIAIISIILLTGCSKSSLESISLSDLYNKIDNKESFVLYIEGNDNTLKDKLEKALLNNNLTGYHIKASKINAEEKLKLEPVIAYDDTTIVFIIEGKDPSRLSHVTNSDTTIKEIEARLKDMNFIKEDE